ncbi:MULTISPECIES: hypothetical protein [Vibrio]|jgi:hypothetical protein|uniref:Lipoprotein n=1 Tax=Vibrio harveyi TaxID=669 RepID=A0ABN4L8E6_VIBHA|nr:MULTISPECIES: hypothetical protein [Vibrio]AIV07870.1 hypothetical protein LA59_20760 [Vibrio harveyi]AMF99753.1 hypothetical protein AL538_18700 [Vibrio harveyi]EKM25487.1 hypothetical protein VCHENC01_3446 [Vibrio harveyi]EKO3823180.1 hypothetical protein [Vibrio harveyi]EKO3824404.1 hypothetical protein [Vibrio harveyi]
MHKAIAATAVILALSGCGGEGMSTDSIPKFKDPRASYQVDGIDLLHHSITDAISDDLLGFEAENLSRKVTYTLDRLSLGLLWEFNVSTLEELQALVPNVGDSKTSSFWKYHLMRLSPDMVMVSTPEEIAHFYYEQEIIETRFGISTYKFSEKPTRITMVVYPEGISIEAFNEGYQAEYDESKGTYTVRLQYEDANQSSHYEKLIVELNGDQVRLEKGTSTMEGLEVKDHAKQSHRFEYNRKQNTLSIQ